MSKQDPADSGGGVEQQATASGTSQVHQAGRDQYFGDVHHHHHAAQPATVVNNSISGGVVNGHVIMGHTISGVPPTETVPARPAQVVFGVIPPLASAFQPRTAIRSAVDRARGSGETVVLTQRTAGLTQLLAGGGGVGKSQLAAFYAHRAVADGTDLVLWADATEPATVTALYARAATTMGAPGVSSGPAATEQNAACFLTWLATTDRSWLVVLDNVTDFTNAGLWPAASRHGGSRVLATTRLRTAAAGAGGRALVDVDRYTSDESAAYLRERLPSALLDDRATELADALGHLPLALGHAAAYVLNRRCTTGAYLDLFNQRNRSLDTLLPRDADTEHYGRPVAAALLLALDAAQQTEPVGLAAPAMRLAALLDPAGHPREFWTTDAVTRYLGEQRAGAAPGGWWSRLRGRRTAAPAVSPEDALAALAVLHNYNLLTDGGPGSGPRAVTIHALTARAAYDTTPNERQPHAPAADALIALWAKHDHTDRDLASALRASSDTLALLAGDLLWKSNGHPLLARTGDSLLDAGLYTAAVDYWEHALSQAERILGPDHPNTLASRANLATSYSRAGHTHDAISITEQVAADTERTLGPNHPNTLTARANLAISYSRVGRTHDAATVTEQVLADRKRVLGTDHPNTLSSRANLAVCYARVGRTHDAITMGEEVLADRKRVLGPDHPNTLTSRANLAVAYARVGRTHDAITMDEQVLADRKHVLGPDHPDTLTSRANLAASYWQAGRVDDAINLLKPTVADLERVLGAEHPATLTVRSALADILRGESPEGRTPDTPPPAPA
ncbi:tetratricopeptide repeat protein [Kitasatospora sp. NPDC058218]|uniref:tetratricopeptide repeat protein n=1 Tax=Kitasatospora sp. NPDC058218 TaxID=3346385 RepID=UPI0036D863AB